MKLSMCATSLVLLASSGAFAAASVNSVSWITDIRRCSASFSGNGSGSSWQDREVAFNPYEGGADILVTNGIETWSSHSAQNSVMSGSSASFEAHSNAAIVAGMQSNPLMSQAQAKFDMWFSVAEPTQYHIQGELAESGHADSTAVVRLYNLQGDMIENLASTIDATRTFQVSGILQPGTYRLYGESLGKCRTVPMQLIAEGSATCRVEFTAAPVPVTPPPVKRPKTLSATLSPPRRH